jgi:hypothetical protein
MQLTVNTFFWAFIEWFGLGFKVFPCNRTVFGLGWCLLFSLVVVAENHIHYNNQGHPCQGFALAMAFLGLRLSHFASWLRLSESNIEYRKRHKYFVALPRSAVPL